MSSSKGIDLVGIHNAGDYGSEFEYDSEADRTRARRQDLAEKPKKEKHKKASQQEVTTEYDREEGRKMRFHILSMDAYTRHKKFINDYLMYFGGSRTDFKRDTSRDKTDLDVIHENQRFLWTDDDIDHNSWEKRMAKKYHDKLFKEYCICDLSRYKENKVAMRWRVEKEVVTGKGQFECGNKRCERADDLRTWEVNFGYVEHGEKRNALVKLRLCPTCSDKLNYHHRRKEVTKRKKKKEITSKQTSPEDDRSQKKLKTQQTPSDSTSEADDRPNTSQGSSSQEATGESLWTGPAKITEEKSRDDEFEDYFEDMFL